EPSLASVLLGAAVRLGGGRDAQRAEHPPAVGAGDVVLARAYQEEGSRYGVHHVETRAEWASGSWRLTGEKIQVLDGHVADVLVVSARTSGSPANAEGITLFLLHRDAPGVRVARQWRIDTRAAALVALHGVRVGAEAVPRAA